MMAQSTPVGVAAFTLLQSTVPLPDDVSIPWSSVPLVQTFVSAADAVPIGSLTCGWLPQAAITDAQTTSGIEPRRMVVRFKCEPSLLEQLYTWRSIGASGAAPALSR